LVGDKLKINGPNKPLKDLKNSPINTWARAIIGAYTGHVAQARGTSSGCYLGLR